MLPGKGIYTEWHAGAFAGNINSKHPTKSSLCASASIAIVNSGRNPGLINTFVLPNAIPGLIKQKGGKRRKAWNRICFFMGG